jgi:hypothetical protein
MVGNFSWLGDLRDFLGVVLELVGVFGAMRTRRHRFVFGSHTVSYLGDAFFADFFGEALFGEALFADFFADFFDFFGDAFFGEALRAALA